MSTKFLEVVLLYIRKLLADIGFFSPFYTVLPIFS